MFDMVSSNLVHCIRLVQAVNQQAKVGRGVNPNPHWKPEKHSPRPGSMGNTVSGIRRVNPPTNNEDFNHPELFEDDEQWSWDIDEFMEGICQTDPPCPNNVSDEPSPVKNYKQWLNNNAARMEMGLPLSELPISDETALRSTFGLPCHVAPRRKPSNFEFSSDMKGDLDIETFLETGGAQERVTTFKQVDWDSENRNPIRLDLLKTPDIRLTPQDVTTHRKKRQNRQALGKSSFRGNELPFQLGIPLEGEEETLNIKDPCCEVLMVRIDEIHESHNDDPMERVDLLDYNSSDFNEFISDDNMDILVK